MHYINITDAKATLSALVEEVMKSGEEVLIGKMGKPLVKLSKYEKATKGTLIGAFKDEVKIIGDIDHWPDDIARHLGIID